MKRGTIILCALLVLAGVIWLLPGKPNPNWSPKFVPLRMKAAGTFTLMFYDWGDAVPIQADEMWINTLSNKTNQHCYLYDIPNRLLLGELLNAGPRMFNGVKSKLLCEGGSLEGLWKWKLWRWLSKWSWGRNLSRNLNVPEAFWILNLKNGTAKEIGRLSQSAGSGSRFVPSPGFRFALNQPSTSSGTEWFLCDLEQETLARINLPGEVAHWWDPTTLLVKDKNHNFVLFDVVTRRTSTLFSAADLTRTLDEFGLPNDPADIGTIATWNGIGYDIYFALSREKWSGKSFLLKADYSTRKLVLLKREFSFHHLGRFDAEGKHYLFQGESGLPGQGGNGGVYLLNLADDTVRTLVEPDQRGAYALARFCADGVIYSRNRQLFKVGLDGKESHPLFDPPVPVER